MTTTASPNHSTTCHQCQGRRYKSLPTIQKDNNSILLLRSELGQLRDQLNKKNKLLEQQQLDMEQLNNKYVAALDQVSTIQHEKDLAERELEDLTSRLFEQANMMVANEKREVYRLRTELELEQMKYKQLLRDQQDISVSSSTSTSSTSTAVSTTSNRSSISTNSSSKCLTSRLHHNDIKIPTTLLSSLSSSSSSSSSCFYSTSSSCLPRILVDGEDSLAYDQQHIQLFYQFINNKPSISQQKQHPFMKQCLLGDVEPCLNFGSNNKLHSIKKMIDSMIQQPCVLEIQSTSSPTITSTCMESDLSLTSTSLIGNTASSIGLRWSRFVSPGVISLVDCAGCGNTLDMQHYYRFRLNDGGNTGDSDWLHLDTPCRDRLKAVCTFFRFMRQQINHPTITTNDQQHQDQDEMGSTKQDDTLLTLYMEMTQLRLAMFYARLGIKRSNGWMDDDTTSVTSTQGPMTPVASTSRRLSSSKAL